ncbi:hypothetical protein NDU88_005637 [Pleurodeles waltl]|uniref:Uncharacterized protein n=1 Tax=Pleurodeles waltl TaxID=8319 RepID=A0AAV7TW35_PLEWA|nr:hypothetical protein NDU88_005637 [Pleurodeles waltl]
MKEPKRVTFNDDEMEEDEIVTHVLETYPPPNVIQQNDNRSNGSGISNIIPTAPLISESAKSILDNERVQMQSSFDDSLNNRQQFEMNIPEIQPEAQIVKTTTNLVLSQGHQGMNLREPVYIQIPKMQSVNAGQMQRVGTLINPDAVTLAITMGPVTPLYVRVDNSGENSLINVQNRQGPSLNETNSLIDLSPVEDLGTMASQQSGGQERGAGAQANGVSLKGLSAQEITKWLEDLNNSKQQERKYI